MSVILSVQSRRVTKYLPAHKQQLAGPAVGGASGTDEISGSTVGVISFAGHTEYKTSDGIYNPINQTGADGDDEDIRLLAHIRGGADVFRFTEKEERRSKNN